MVLELVGKVSYSFLQVYKLATRPCLGYRFRGLGFRSLILKLLGRVLFTNGVPSEVVGTKV